MTMLTAEELLAGSALKHNVAIPSGLIANNGKIVTDGQVVLRPLMVRDLQKISKASSEDIELSAALMIQQALVEPELNFEQITKLPAGLAKFLVERINEISGISTPQNALQELVQAPLARACFVLAKEFGWTPEQVSGMTIGQILLYLEMANKGEENK